MSPAVLSVSSITSWLLLLRYVCACTVAHCLTMRVVQSDQLDAGVEPVFYPFNPDATTSMDLSMNGSFLALGLPGDNGVLKKWSAAAELAEAERLVRDVDGSGWGPAVFEQ